MSHLRDLLHKPSHTPVPEHAAPEFIQGTSFTKTMAVAEATTPEIADTLVSVMPDFPVEEAQLSPETRVIFYANPRGPAADRFRLLRMRLKDFRKSSDCKKILVTGPLADVGKSTVVLNLATALAERGKRTVLVIEADLHHSGMAEMLKVRQWPGLTECLTDESMSPLSAIRKIEPLGWHLLPAGEPRLNPTELLQTVSFARVMQRVTPHFDWVLIDSPPVIPLTDSLSLQQHVDGCLLVVRAGETPRDAVEKTMSLLGNKKVIGVVLNGVEARDHHYYQYYGERNLPED